VPEFYVRDLAPLRQELAAVLTDRAREMRVVDEPLKPIVYLDQTEKGWLSFQVSYQFGNSTVRHSQLSGVADLPFIRVNENTWARMDPHGVRATDKKLQKLGAAPTPGGYRVPASEFATLEEFVASMGGQSIISDRYQSFIDQLTAFWADDTFHLSPAIETHLTSRKITLRPYQRAGVHWLTWLYDNQLHGLLADDMGLGKTLQCILTLRHAYETSNNGLPSLVIAPASVLPHWERELERYFPQMRVYRYHGPGRSLNPLHSERPTIAVSTYDTVRSSVEELAKVPFFYIVLDEATSVKNPTSRRSKAVKALNSAHRLSLSGTPVENRPAELWSIFDFLMSGHLGAYGTFERVFENRIVVGDNDAAERLGRRIRPFMLRRLKEEVARDLPEKIEMDEWCSLTTEQATLYNHLQVGAEPVLSALRGGGRVDYAGSILPLLTKLKQVCDHPAIVNKNDQPLSGRSEKFDWITERIQAIVDGGEQVLIFSHFLGMLSLLESAVIERGIPYIRIDGATTKRQELIDRFNVGRAKVALLSIRAAGHGITVTAANHVIHADRWWNPAVENQATDRVHRIGQTKTVYVYRIMVENTLEERIEKLLRRKQDIADTIINAARLETQQWTREELLEILRPLE
jgi:SNF2 family DNA or RNA helicase